MKFFSINSKSKFALFFAFVLVFLGSSWSTPVFGQTLQHDPQSQVGVDEKLGDQINLDMIFTDHTGQKLPLRQLVDGEKPVLLTLNYYSCATLCSVQLNAVLDGLKQLEWRAGEEFDIVTISIDPKEDSELAKGKRDSYLKSLGQGDVGWNFLVGEDDVIVSLADQIGYRYSFDPETNQYAHPAVIMFLSPQGKVSRYIYGIQYPGRDIKFALMDASAGRVGSTIDKLILSCFSYDHTVGKYTPAAFGIMRLGGLISLFVLTGFVLVMWRQEKSNVCSGSTQ